MVGPTDGGGYTQVVHYSVHPEAARARKAGDAHAPLRGARCNPLGDEAQLPVEHPRVQLKVGVVVHIGQVGWNGRPVVLG